MSDPEIPSIMSSTGTPHIFFSDQSSFFKDRNESKAEPISSILFEEYTDSLRANNSLEDIIHNSIDAGRSINIVPAFDPNFDDKIDETGSKILTIINLLNEYVFIHPFRVIRRQAQVNNRSTAYHLTPFTVIPYMVHIERTQGVTAFFKGLPSSLVNYVLLISTESLISNLLSYPLEYDFQINELFTTRLLQHLVVKSLSILVVTPFICSASVESVQSWIVSESPSPFEHIKEGFMRIFHFKSDRKLPFYMLALPSIAYFLSHYLLVSITKASLYQLLYSKSAMRKAIQLDEKSSEAKTADTTNNDTKQSKECLMNKLKCSLYANLFADIVLYPFETILYRLFLQGTRTIIDNVDRRTAVIPLISNYDSFTDCYQTVVRNEGPVGLFKGFGALLLQYGLQTAAIHLTNCGIDAMFNFS